MLFVELEGSGFKGKGVLRTSGELSLIHRLLSEDGEAIKERYILIEGPQNLIDGIIR